MGISLADLDQIMNYDPTTHSVGSMPTVRVPSAAAARNADFGIGAVGNNLSKPTAAPTGIPSLGASAPDLSRNMTSIPSLSHTLAGNPAGDVVGSPNALQIAKPETKWQKLEHGLETAGNIAGNAIAPGVMLNIPGTQLNKEFQQKREAELEGKQADTALKTAEAQGWQPMTVTDPTTGQDITLPARFAGALEGKAVTTEGAEKRNENTVAGENTRAAGVQAGQNARTQENIAGRAANVATEQAGANTRAAESNKTREDIAANYGGSFQPLYDPNGQVVGYVNSKHPTVQTDASGNRIEPGSTGGNTGQGTRMEQMNQNRFNTQYVNPANQAEQQYQRATEAVDAYNNNPKTGAAAMVLFAQHLGTTLGGIKGAAIGEGAQKMHQDAIGLEDRAQRFMDYLKTGQPLSQNQVHDFYSLIQNTRQLQWETTVREAARRKMPIDFLPADVKIRITSPDGKETQDVPANLVQKYVDKGGTVGY